MDVQHAASPAKALIPATEVDSSDAVLTQHRGTHDAGLDRDIEVCLAEDLDGVLGEDAGDGNELGVPGAVEGPVGLVHAAANDLAVFDEDAPDGRFIALECELGLIG